MLKLLIDEAELELYREKKFKARIYADFSRFLSTYRSNNWEVIVLKMKRLSKISEIEIRKIDQFHRTNIMKLIPSANKLIRSYNFP